MNDLTQLFTALLQEHRSIDIADDVFKKMIAEDPALRSEYSDWCHESGYTEKRGFADFCEEYLENQDSIFDSLSEYNDE